MRFIKEDIYQGIYDNNIIINKDVDNWLKQLKT